MLLPESISSFGQGTCIHSGWTPGGGGKLSTSRCRLDHWGRDKGHCVYAVSTQPRNRMQERKFSKALPYPILRSCYIYFTLLVFTPYLSCYSRRIEGFRCPSFRLRDVCLGHFFVRPLSNRIHLYGIAGHTSAETRHIHDRRDQQVAQEEIVRVHTTPSDTPLPKRYMPCPIAAGASPHSDALAGL